MKWHLLGIEGAAESDSHTLVLGSQLQLFYALAGRRPISRAAEKRKWCIDSKVRLHEDYRWPGSTTDHPE